MNSYRRILPLVLALGAFACATTAQAQIRLSMKMSASQYVAHEPVLATVTITNHAGRDLLIFSEGVGRGSISWLDFSVSSGRNSLTPRTKLSFKAVTIPAGRSISKTIDLTGLYRVTEAGNFRAFATVRLPDGGGAFNSNSVPFNVTKGKMVFQQRVGDPKGRSVREFQLSIHNSSQKSSLYAHVIDIRTGRTLQAFRMGDLISYKKPKARVDRKNVLHVLYLAAPNTYAHGRVTPDGKYLGTVYFKPAPGSKPALATFGSGDVVVSGGITYDPKAERQQRGQIRKLSERPALTYR